MANTYTWTISSIEVINELNGYEKVVYNVHWRIHATDESGTYHAERYGETSVAPYTPGEPFIPFNELTLEILSGWVIQTDPDRYNEVISALDADIQAQISPTVTRLSPPWAN